MKQDLVTTQDIDRIKEIVCRIKKNNQNLQKIFLKTFPFFIFISTFDNILPHERQNKENLTFDPFKRTSDNVLFQKPKYDLIKKKDLKATAISQQNKIREPQQLMER